MKTVFVFLLAFTLVLPAFAEKVTMPPVTMPSAASNGFGGHHVAYTDNTFSLIVNPAAMVETQERSFFALGGSLFSPQTTADLLFPIGDFIDMIKGILDEDYSALGNTLQFLSDKNGKVTLGADLPQVPVSVAWVANGFGFGLWNRSFVDVEINQLELKAEAYMDAMLPIGFAFKVFDLDGHTVDAGLSFKPFVRVRAEIENTITGLVSDAEGLVDDTNIPVIAGGSANFGLLYRWDKGLRVGATATDLFSFGKVVMDIQGEDKNSYYVPYSINLGAAWDFNLGNFWKDAPKLLAKSGFAVAVDWMDFTNFFNQDDYINHRNFLLDLRAGLEISLFEIIKIRVGMNEMLPAVGLGFDFGAIRIDASYYGKEFGMEPGELSTAVVDFCFSIRPEAKKRQWPWTKRSVVGLLTGIETIPTIEVMGQE